MAEQDFKRKLTAILSADVEGYSLLMRDDEEATIRTLTTYRKAITNLIQQYRGRLVDATGDNLLSEFTSVVDAVNCAVEIQRELAERNAELPDGRRMQFRIGINLGDVVEEGERIYGDGVNIAARMEGLAEGGGICISGTTYDQVKHKIGLEYEYLGEQEVKNFIEPVRAYRVLSYPGAAAHRVIKAKKAVGKTWRNVVVAIAVVLVVGAAVAIWNLYFRAPSVEVASVEKMAYPLPDKPSIAVLPFENMSGDSKQEYFSDGITEEIITSLSKVPQLFVIARNSTFTYKNKPVKIQQVAEDLGVRYVLEGSVRRSGEQVRITAQLIDAITGNHLWAERYDRELKEIFAVQDEITKKIITALQVRLTQGEQAKTASQGTNNLDAYLKIIQARENLYRASTKTVPLARQLSEEAIALDPGYATAYRMLGVSHMHSAILGISKSPKQSIGKAIALVKKAIELDEADGYNHAVLGFLLTLTRQHDKAVAEAEKGVTLNPNVADIHAWVGMTLRYSGRWQEAISAYEKAIRLNPIPPGWYLFGIGLAYGWTGRYEEAITECQKAVRDLPNSFYARMFMTLVYSLSGRDEEAQAEADEMLRINPKFTLESWKKKLRYKNKDDNERLIDALRKAGLPESPPLPLPDKPSIAVLPFENMSDDPEQEYFSDGLTEDIITALSKIRNMFVIARNSTFIYKGKPVKVQQVSRELGVRYVLEGSVRRSGDRVRITAQLIDATTGNHLWAERYDRDLKDIFAVQDEITKKIITAMQVKLTEGEQARAAAKGTKNLDAYLKYLQARNYLLHKLNPENNALAKQLAEEAIALDPNYAWAYYILGRTHMMDVWYASNKSPKDSIAKSRELAKKAIVLDDSLAEAYALLGYLFTMTGQHDKAIAQVEKAVALNPNSADLHYRLGKVLIFVGRWEESIPEYKKAIRFDPIPPNYYLWSLGYAYAWTGQYEEAITWCEKAVRQQPDDIFARIMMASVYSFLGRDEEAQVEAAEVLRINPKFSLEKYAKKIKYKNQDDKDRVIEALRKAGLK
jgi:TolB-like protein/class 3 adenylate cyclase/Tfp pilus assembly protein PilF